MAQGILTRAGRGVGVWDRGAWLWAPSCEVSDNALTFCLVCPAYKRLTADASGAAREADDGGLWRRRLERQLETLVEDCGDVIAIQVRLKGASAVWLWTVLASPAPHWRVLLRSKPLGVVVCAASPDEAPKGY